MSKAVKKVFSGVKKVVKKVGSFVKKYWKEILLVAAVVFTAGAALGYVGMASGGGLAFGAGAGAGGMAGVGTAWSALGNTVLGAFGVKGSGTGVFGQSTVAGMEAAGVANSGALAAGNVSAAGIQGSGVITQGIGNAAPGMAGSTSSVTTNAAGQVVAQGGKAVGTEAVKAGATQAAKQGVTEAAKGGWKKWAASQSAGDWAQLGGLGLATVGALGKDDGKEYIDYTEEAPPIYDPGGTDLISGTELAYGSNAQQQETPRQREQRLAAQAVDNRRMTVNPQRNQQAALMQRGPMQANIQNRRTDKDEQAKGHYPQLLA